MNLCGVFQIDWIRESSQTDPRDRAAASADDKPYLIATGRKIVTAEKRYRVFRPHNSALSVLIIRRAKKKDAGIFRCNLSGSTTRHKYMILNVTGRWRIGCHNNNNASRRTAFSLIANAPPIIYTGYSVAVDFLE